MRHQYLLHIRLSRLRAALFVPEDEVDPEVEMFADVFALERGAILRHEIPRVARPSTIGSNPEARGSSVPAWPTRRCPLIDRTRATRS